MHSAAKPLVFLRCTTGVKEELREGENCRKEEKEKEKEKERQEKTRKRKKRKTRTGWKQTMTMIMMRDDGQKCNRIVDENVSFSKGKHSNERFRRDGTTAEGGGVDYADDEDEHENRRRRGHEGRALAATTATPYVMSDRALGHHNLAVVMLVIVLFFFMRWLLKLVFYNEIFHWGLMVALSGIVTSYVLPAAVAVFVLMRETVAATTSGARARLAAFVYTHLNAEFGGGAPGSKSIEYGADAPTSMGDAAKYMSALDGANEKNAREGAGGMRGRVGLTVAAFEAAMTAAMPHASEIEAAAAAAGFDALLRETLPDGASDATVNVLDVALDDALDDDEQINHTAVIHDEHEYGEIKGEGVLADAVIPNYIQNDENVVDIAEKDGNEEEDEEPGNFESGSGSNTWSSQRGGEGSAVVRLRTPDKHIMRYFTKASRKLRFGPDPASDRGFDVASFRLVVEDEETSLWCLKNVAPPTPIITTFSRGAGSRVRWTENS